ncbi:MAG: BT_3928 family protein [Bacteroidota bacterium]
MKIIRAISRVLLGLVFMFSGFVKAVDPLGSMYKFQEYFVSFHMTWLIPYALALGILLCCCEFLLGFAFVFNAKLKSFSWLMLLFMLFFLILTFILALTNPVSDCGCFGDALILTNWQTFYKNLILIALALIIFSGRKQLKNRYPNVTQYGILTMGLAIILWVSIFSLRHLPLIDFMPWKVGNVISEQVLPTEEKADITLLYKNKETGQTYEYTSKTLPWKDTTFFKKLVFVEQKKKVISPYKEAPIHDFMIDDVNKVNHNNELIGNTKFQFLLVSHDLSEVEKSVFVSLNSFYAQCVKDSVGFVALCGSDFVSIDYFRHDVQADYPFFAVDETALKTVVRSNPGLVLLKNGVVLDKWAWRDFPTYEKFKDKIATYDQYLAKILSKKKDKK